MQHVEKKCYAAPTLNELGDLKEITRGGHAGNSDSEPYVADTAFGPEGLGS